MSLHDTTMAKWGCLHSFAHPMQTFAACVESASSMVTAATSMFVDQENLPNHPGEHEKRYERTDVHHRAPPSRHSPSASAICSARRSSAPEPK